MVLTFYSLSTAATYHSSVLSHLNRLNILIPDGGEDASGVTAEPSWMHLRDGSFDYTVIHCTLFQE